MLSPQFGIPSSDPGASFGKQASTPDTSGIFIGSSMDYATSWRNRKGSGAPNAAAAGRGNLLPNDAPPAQPVQVN
jgi:hypothetical protein